MAFDHDCTPSYDYPNSERDWRPAQGKRPRHHGLRHKIRNAKAVTDLVRGLLWQIVSAAVRSNRDNGDASLPASNCIRFFKTSHQVLGGASRKTFARKTDC